MEIMDISKLNVGYLYLSQQKFNHDVRQLHYTLDYIKNNPTIANLFITYEIIDTPKDAKIKEQRRIKSSSVCNYD